MVPFVKFLFPLLGLYWLIVVVVLVLWRKRLGGSRYFSRSIPRPVAYSDELELRERYFKLVFWASILTFVPAYTTLADVRFRGPAVVFVLTAAGVVLTLLGVINAYKHVKAIQRLRVQRDGKLVVAQELNEKRSFEHRVVHDIPADDGCIDHVVVGPTGVFVLETNAYLPQPDDPAEARGQILAGAAGQADRKARWLRTWLAAAIREYVSVQPMVISTGHDVQQHKETGVRTVNETELGGLFRGPRTLQPTQVHRIADALEQRSRETTTAPPDRGSGFRGQTPLPQH